MSRTYKAGLNAARTICYVTISPQTLPGGATIALPDIVHDHASDPFNASGANHVLFHDIRELLYKRKKSDGTAGATFPNGMYDLSRVAITKSGTLWDATDIVITPVPDIDLSVGTPATLVIKYVSRKAVLDTAVNTNFSYVSSVPAKATVSAAGVVTPVAVGTTVITVTQANTGYSKTVLITVVA